MVNLRTESIITKQTADELLKESNIVSILKKYGKVRIAGSYALDLMLTPDIDIYVLNPNNQKEAALTVLNTLIGQEFFNGFLFYDFVRFQKTGFPRGYYVGLKIPFQDTKWKIDIWFIESFYATDPLFLKIMNATKNQKMTILKLKKFRNQYLDDNISSYFIYEAVLKHHVKSIDEFRKLVKHHHKPSTSIRISE